MKVGTKSVLLGIHCFFLHPFIVALAWYKLYGFPFNIRLWFAFFLYDIGYIGKKDMDGETEGELHPYLGAKIMKFLFGKKWYLFTLCHSRYLAKKINQSYSRLCVADKLSIYYYPNWLYLLLANLSGEIHDYIKSATLKHKEMNFKGLTQREWLKTTRDYMIKWAYEHKDIREDTWTKI